MGEELGGEWGVRGRGEGKREGSALWSSSSFQPMFLKLDGTYPGNPVWYQLSANIAGHLFCVL